MHLRYPEPFGDLGLRHVLEESKLQNRLLAFWQRRQEWANRFDVEHLLEIGVEISEAVTDRSSVGRRWLTPARQTNRWSMRWTQSAPAPPLRGRFPNGWRSRWLWAHGLTVETTPRETFSAAN